MYFITAVSTAIPLIHSSSSSSSTPGLCVQLTIEARLAQLDLAVPVLALEVYVSHHLQQQQQQQWQW
jgi:hypothetical protein